MSKFTAFGTISSIIGSGFVVFAVTTFYSGFINTTAIDAELRINEPHPENRSASIELTNHGRVPATNLVLTFQSPSNITDTNLFSTENWTSITHNQSFVSVDISRLAHGTGGLILLNASLNGSQPTGLPTYNVYATYDQGSLTIEGAVGQLNVASD